MRQQTSPNVALIPLDEAGRPLITADMKAKCIGELSIERELACPECDADDPGPECEICHGKIEYSQKELLDWSITKKAYKMMAEAAIAEKPQYSLDHDVLGIRALVVDTVTGVLFLGNCEAERPLAGHWLEPIYEMGSATAAQSNEIEQLRGVNVDLFEEHKRVRQELKALKAENKSLRTDVNQLNLAEEGAKEAFGVVVQEKEDLKRECARLQKLLDFAYEMARKGAKA